jgi:hypothetical protein
MSRKRESNVCFLEPVKTPVVQVVTQPPAPAPAPVVIHENNLFAQYSSDEHLLGVLRQQADSLKQVIVTIIGGDSYSLFAWDWYERMSQISNSSTNCHCFIVAMDEIAAVLAVKQGIPVYYMTFSFEEQTQWTNIIEARQHSLFRVGHAKFSAAAKIARLGYSVVMSEMDVFW